MIPTYCEWDERLTQRGAQFVSGTPVPGMPYWRLIKARWYNTEESQGRHHIFADMLDSAGVRKVGVPIRISWSTDSHVITTEQKSGEQYSANFPMWNLAPAYNATPDGVPGDAVHGMGLGEIDAPHMAHHTSYGLIWQLVTASEPPTTGTPPIPPIIEPPRETMGIYALHDSGGEKLIRDARRSGWIIMTEAIGHDPHDMSGRDYRDIAHDGIKVLVRINNAYGSGGTIPLPQDYANFAKRCANFVAATTGAHAFIIANETQMQWDWPDGQEITYQQYIDCYQQVYATIKAVRPDALIIPQAVACWNDTTKYPGNERGDWIKFQADLMKLPCNGIAIHAYSHGYNPALITDTSTMDAPFQDRFYNFQVYRQFLKAIPSDRRHLPVYITETNGNESWPNHNSGWVQSMYKEINDWNRDNEQQIHCAALFRWARFDTKWDISSKPGSLEDFQMALAKNYQVYPRSMAADGYVMAFDGLRLRAGPSTNTQILDVMPYGTPLRIISAIIDWKQVEFNGKQGWASATYISTFPPPAMRSLPRPFAGNYPVTQGFGGNQEAYSRFSCGGVPLQGHTGIDYGMAVGVSILAVDNGVVREAAFDGTGYGYYVKVQHKWGETIYAHFSDLRCQAGQTVRTGDIIGLSGNTGNSTGPHLHFGLRLHPYNRGDGYCGCSDPAPLLKS